MYKVIDSTYGATTSTKAMIGGVYERHSLRDYEEVIALWNKDKTMYYRFNLSDVQELVPRVTFDGNPICIGDTVTANGIERVVYGYSFFDGKVYIATVQNNDYEIGCGDYELKSIESHTPLYKPQKVEHTTEELIAELNRRGGYQISKK